MTVCLLFKKKDWPYSESVFWPVLINQLEQISDINLGERFLLSIAPDSLTLCVHFVLQIDILEDPVICNVIILQTVLQEVRHRSAPVYKRLKDIIHEKEKRFYTFTNEHHR